MIPFHGTFAIADSKQHDAEMNDGWRRKRVAGLRVSLRYRPCGNERNDDKLQPDQGTGRRTDYHVEVFPSVE